MFKESTGATAIEAMGCAAFNEARENGMSLRLRIGIAMLALTVPAFIAAPAQAAGVTAEGFIREWDADHDGTLSLDEVKKAAGARFDALDRDHHGTLDRKELGATMSPKEFREADADKDGTLDKSEYLTVVEKLFAAVDKNRDGKLDKKKLNSTAGRSLLRLFGSRQGPLF
jgi:EF hand